MVYVANYIQVDGLFNISDLALHRLLANYILNLAKLYMAALTLKCYVFS